MFNKIILLSLMAFGLQANADGPAIICGMGGGQMINPTTLECVDSYNTCETERLSNQGYRDAEPGECDAKAIAEVKSTRCLAAKSAIRNLSKTYIDKTENGKTCYEDTDCKYVNHVAGPLCGAYILNKQQAAGAELMKTSTEYKRLVSVVNDAGNCGAVARCAPRPDGAVRCIANKCMYDERVPPAGL